MAKTELAIVENTLGLLPNPEELSSIANELQDIIAESPRKLFATMKIAAAGANVFQVQEPGAEDLVSVPPPLRVVIVASHPANTRWEGTFETRQPGEHPACRSTDGINGTDLNGEIHACATCPYNQYGEDGERKVCGNRIQLYVMREGDIFPTLFSLPPSSKTAFNKYRIYANMTVKQPLHMLITEMGLTAEKNKRGVLYSKITFKPVGILPKETAMKIKQMTDKLVQTAKDVVTDEVPVGAEPVYDAPPVSNQGFTSVTEDLPDGF